MAEGAMGISAEVYKAIVAVVDERVKEIRVTREDFDDLKGIVRELVQGQTELQGAVKELAQGQIELRETVRELAQGQTALEGTVRDLAQGQTELRETVRDLAQAHTALEATVRDLAQGQTELRETVRELARNQQELAHAQARTEKALANLAQQVGRMTDTLGYGLEDLGRWVLPAYFERTYAITGVERCTRKFIKVNRREVEVNLYAEGKRNGETIVLLGESKNRIGKTEVNEFMTRLRELESAFDKPTFRFLFGYWAHPRAEKLARENSIEVISSYQLTR